MINKQNMKTDLRKIIKEHYKQNKHTQDYLAGFCGCANPTISNFFTGKKGIAYDSLMKLMELYNLKVVYEDAITSVKYKNNVCDIVRVWGEGDNRYFDLKTVNETEKGIIEKYWSVHLFDLRAQGNDI